jgi:hypothetical protein
MSTNTNPDAASVSSARDNPCYGGDPNVASLNVFADDEHSYLLPLQGHGGRMFPAEANQPWRQSTEPSELLGHSQAGVALDVI